jgi:hypothetical protein
MEDGKKGPGRVSQRKTKGIPASKFANSKLSAIPVPVKGKKARSVLPQTASRGRFTSRGYYRPRMSSRSRSRSPGRRIREQEEAERIKKMWKGYNPPTPPISFAQLFGSRNEPTAKRHQRVALLAEGAAWEAGIKNHMEIAKAGVYAIMALEESPNISDEDAVGRGLVKLHIQPPPITVGNTEGWKSRMLAAAAEAAAATEKAIKEEEEDEEDEEDEEVGKLSKYFNRGTTFGGLRRTRRNRRSQRQLRRSSRSKRGSRKN